MLRVSSTVSVYAEPINDHLCYLPFVEGFRLQVCMGVDFHACEAVVCLFVCWKQLNFCWDC